MADLIGKTMGRYRIVELIGQGPTAAVYKAYQADLERYVAVKVFPGLATAETEPLPARFKQRVWEIAALRHPNIISLLDLGSEGGAPYIVMEYLPGTTLKARLDELAVRHARMPWDEVDCIGSAVAGALAYAHQKGIAHRDVKPANVLLTPQVGIILTDFGLVPLTGSGGDPATISAYLAPEQCRGEPGDLRSDSYALGVLLYEMVTGRLPFEADTPLALLEKRLDDPVPPPGQVNPAVLPTVERIILKALAENPADRYQKASDIAADLAGAFRPFEAPEPNKPPSDIPHVDFVVRGKVAALLDRGFSLDMGQGTALIVATLSHGNQLGLRPGDEVGVFGGPDPQTGVFRSGAIHKILPNGKEVEIEDDPNRPPKPRWKLW